MKKNRLDNTESTSVGAWGWFIALSAAVVVTVRLLLAPYQQVPVDLDVKTYLGYSYTSMHFHAISAILLAVLGGGAIISKKVV